MANPIQAFVAQLQNGTAVAGSGSLTVSFQITAGFQAFIPIKVVTPANISAGPEVHVYRSVDGGANWETESTVVDVFRRASNSTMMHVSIIETGQYLIRVLAGGPNTATVYVDTAMVITAYV